MTNEILWFMALGNGEQFPEMSWSPSDSEKELRDASLRLDGEFVLGDVYLSTPREIPEAHIPNGFRRYPFSEGTSRIYQIITILNDDPGRLPMGIYIITGMRAEGFKVYPGGVHKFAEDAMSRLSAEGGYNIRHTIGEKVSGFLRRNGKNHSPDTLIPQPLYEATLLGSITPAIEDVYPLSLIRLQTSTPERFFGI